MTSVLFIWVLNAGQVHLEGIETFYTLEACQTAARNAENAPMAFAESSDVQVRAFCNTKRLNKDK
ncbi:hypothetical protein GTL58_004363 [Salmonella enterica]|nr:hypothetical protein [Salmonella enterica]EIC4908520.1 hypothetical protein [Salmonella enterica]EIC6911797.1 hypothetical protein [Salmonella enterica subsp. enterica serovar Infantis]